jgi:hypothetical protein
MLPRNMRRAMAKIREMASTLGEDVIFLIGMP